MEHDGSVTIKILHTFDFSEHPVFKERGNITIQSLRVGQATVQQNALTFDDKKKLRVYFGIFCFVLKVDSYFQELAAHNGFYQIKSVVTANDGSERIFLSTVKAVGNSILSY